MKKQIRKFNKFTITNDNSLVFNSIEDEEYRTYHFANGDVTLTNPVALHVRFGGHRVLTADGISHYVPPGWLHISWKNKPGAVRFNF